uniref:Uncharacterized protein n=1 Tax=Arundo donax TaxID=35708 RepID=A0A0A9HR76_ARUDO
MNTVYVCALGLCPDEIISLNILLAWSCFPSLIISSISIV